MFVQRLLEEVNQCMAIFKIKVVSFSMSTALITFLNLFTWLKNC